MLDVWSHCVDVDVHSQLTQVAAAATGRDMLLQLNVNGPSSIIHAHDSAMELNYHHHQHHQSAVDVFASAKPVGPDPDAASCFDAVHADFAGLPLPTTNDQSYRYFFFLLLMIIAAYDNLQKGQLIIVN